MCPNLYFFIGLRNMASHAKNGILVQNNSFHNKSKAPTNIKRRDITSLVVIDNNVFVQTRNLLVTKTDCPEVKP